MCAPSARCPMTLAQADGGLPDELEVRGEVYLPKARVRRDQRASRGGRQTRIRESAQRGGRRGAPARSLGHRDARPADLHVRDRSARQDPEPGGGARHPRRAGISRQSAPPARRVDRRGARISRALVRAAPRPRLRHRRRGHQGRVARRAGGARHDLARAALGDRVQVPARGARDPGARHPRAGRADRRGDAGGDPRADAGRGVDGAPLHAPQRG